MRMKHRERSAEGTTIFVGVKAAIRKSTRQCSKVAPALCGAQANDFGSEVIPGAKDMGMHIQAYLYDGYWEDIGTVEAFYEANLALTDSPSPKFRCSPSLCMQAP